MTDFAVFSPVERRTDAAASRPIVSSSHLEALAVGLSRAEASRGADNIRPFRPRMAPRIDPAGWAKETIEGAANDLIFAANEAKLAGDLDALLQIQQIAESLLVHVATVETLAVKYADDVLRERGAK